MPICKISFRFLKKWRQDSRMYSNWSNSPSPFTNLKVSINQFIRYNNRSKLHEFTFTSENIYFNLSENLWKDSVLTVFRGFSGPNRCWAPPPPPRLKEKNFSSLWQFPDYAPAFNIKYQWRIQEFVQSWTTHSWNSVKSEGGTESPLEILVLTSTDPLYTPLSSINLIGRLPIRLPREIGRSFSVPGTRPSPGARIDRVVLPSSFSSFIILGNILNS